MFSLDCDPPIILKYFWQSQCKEKCIFLFYHICVGDNGEGKNKNKALKCVNLLSLRLYVTIM
jgi:hypothetical protein